METRPLPSQVQDLMEDLDDFAAAPGGQAEENWPN
jgi:hypothetical protein